MAGPTPQQQKLTALQAALAAQRQSQTDAKAAAEKGKTQSSPTK